MADRVRRRQRFPVVGIDPGSKESGVVTLDAAGEIVDHFVLKRKSDVDPIRYATWVGRRCLEITIELEATLFDCSTDDVDPASLRVRVAVEGITDIVPHVNDKPINPMYLVHTGIVLGAILGQLAGATVKVVRPGGHGSNPLGTYPSELVAPGERRMAGWQLRVGERSSIRHARSAFDVANASQSPLYGAA